MCITFALFKLPMLLWGTLYKLNSIQYLKFLISVFNRTMSISRGGVINGNEKIIMTPSFFFQWRLASLSLSLSFNIQNDVGRRCHHHKSVISYYFKILWCQAIMSLWREKGRQWYMTEKKVSKEVIYPVSGKPRS